MKTIKEPARDIPVRAEADVLVVGGGPAGIMAAAHDQNVHLGADGDVACRTMY